VVFTAPDDPSKLVIKRVVATEGEYVINNDVYERIRKGHFFAVGDNMNQSIDSRRYGQVPISLIRGTAEYVILPYPRKIKRTPPRTRTFTSAKGQPPKSDYDLLTGSIDDIR